MCSQTIDLLERAFLKMKEASLQDHSGHWDRQGTHGANCPECVRASKLRKEAMDLYKRAINLKSKIEMS